MRILRIKKELVNIGRFCCLGFFIVLNSSSVSANFSAQQLIKKGWSNLVKDENEKAQLCFFEAYSIATKAKKKEDQAESLLNIGICVYSASQTKGLYYAFRAMRIYQSLDNSNPQLAKDGRSKCLQLISTIYGRQRQYHKMISTSKEALTGLSQSDASGVRGLMYNAIGFAYEKLKQSDSATFYYLLGFEDHKKHANTTYLPGSYIHLAEIELKNGNHTKSKTYFDASLALATKTANKQASVVSLLGLGEWYLKAQGNKLETAKTYTRAEQISIKLDDKSFLIKTWQHWFDLRQYEKNHESALSYQLKINQLNDSLFSVEKQEIQSQLEVEYDVAEKERKIRLIEKEKQVTFITNILLASILLFVLLAFFGVVVFMKRIRKRDQILYKTREELVKLEQQQQLVKEQQLQEDLSVKENQLSSLAIQMLHKNEWIEDLMNRIEAGTLGESETMLRVLEKELHRNNEWTEFNSQFENINANFYQRVKAVYPEISPNDLKLCALLKLNLSTKEIAAILAITPDSVKTARYRLRKKFQLQTEENLIDFIFNLN